MTLRRADDEVYVLGTALTATGNPVLIKGGSYNFYVAGTVGSALEFRLEIQAPNGTWSRLQIFTGSIVSFSAANIPMAQTGIEIPPGFVRIFIGGGTATSINAWLIGLG